MENSFKKNGITRRKFIENVSRGIFFSFLMPFTSEEKTKQKSRNDLFWVKAIPNQPFYKEKGSTHHTGIDSLLYLMGAKGLKFYRSKQKTILSGPTGMIRHNDVVLIKVNAQWKYRGCTNSDLIRGLIQRILEHPDVFTGEVVIFENGQGRGSLNCDTSASYSDAEVHANAIDETHSFSYLVNSVFNDPRVSSYLLDPIRTTFIEDTDHVSEGYRIYQNVSYPCFTTAGGHRVELKRGIWKRNGYKHNLKLINVPVLKHHDVGGSEITAALKHFYGIVSMADGQGKFRHYSGLGATCGKMAVSVCTPVLNILDAIWVSHASLRGYPASTTFRANQILASQDPVALDYFAAKRVLFPIDHNRRHHPDFSNIEKWLTQAKDMINSRGGLYNPKKGILVDQVTDKREKIKIHAINAETFIENPRQKA